MVVFQTSNPCYLDGTGFSDFTLLYLLYLLIIQILTNSSGFSIRSTRNGNTEWRLYDGLVMGESSIVMT